VRLVWPPRSGALCSSGMSAFEKLNLAIVAVLTASAFGVLIKSKVDGTFAPVHFDKENSRMGVKNGSKEFSSTSSQNQR